MLIESLLFGRLNERLNIVFVLLVKKDAFRRVARLIVAVLLRNALAHCELILAPGRRFGEDLADAVEKRHESHHHGAIDGPHEKLGKKQKQKQHYVYQEANFHF